MCRNSLLYLFCFASFCFIWSSCQSVAEVPIQKSLDKKEKVFKNHFGAMGSLFAISAVHRDSIAAHKAISVAEEEIGRIEKLISSWDPRSQTSEINRQAGLQVVKVDAELFELIRRSKKVSDLTNGAFDISFASIDKIWRFDGSMDTLPSEEMIKASVSKINWQNIQLNAQDTSVFLKEKGMKIGFGAIGKGYAANKACQLMKAMGINNGIVNAGGDLFAWGTNLKDKKWRIGIADPKQENDLLAWLELEDNAVVTSGNYERFALINGVRYAHIIDPRTGYPVTGLKSVSVLCPDAELADALATAVFVLGKEKGLALINQLNGVEGLLITDEDELVQSKSLQLNFKED